MVHFPLAILGGRYHELYNIVHGPLSVGHTWQLIPWTSTSNTRSASINKLNPTQLLTSQFFLVMIMIMIMIVLYNTISSVYIYSNNNNHNLEVNVYCIEGLPATCAGSQQLVLAAKKLISYRAELQNKNNLIIKLKNY